jgi:hypothetical protein
MDLELAATSNQGSIEARLAATLYEIVAMLLIERSTDLPMTVARADGDDSAGIEVPGPDPQRWLH